MIRKRTSELVEARGQVYCPICTHIVEATIVRGYKRDFCKPGQLCAHCHSSLDAGYVLHWDQAA
jgi:hypothetical protein